MQKNVDPRASGGYSLRMTKHRFELIARAAMNQFGLHDWSFGWDRSKIAFGRCWYRKRRITISALLFEANKNDNFGEVWDTVLHEISHALAGIHDQHYDHGAPWKKWCAITGAKPQQFYCEEQVVPVPAKYHLVNEETKEVVYKYHRLPKWAKYSSRTTVILNKKKMKVLLVKIK